MRTYYIGKDGMDNLIVRANKDSMIKQLGMIDYVTIRAMSIKQAIDIAKKMFGIVDHNKIK